MIKVFLIEDEIVIREALERMIPWKEYGFELVGKAKDGEIALPMIRKSKPDVLITDIKMPFMDGLTLSSIVKKEFPNIRIVIVSGYDDFEYARKAIAIGVDDYLLKPIARADFEKVLKKIQKDFEEKDRQQDYYKKFEREMKEYENNSRRDFLKCWLRNIRIFRKFMKKQSSFQLILQLKVIILCSFLLRQARILIL